MIANVEVNIFSRDSKTLTFHLFTSQSYFKVNKGIRINVTHYFIMKILNKREIQQILSSHSSDIDFHSSLKLYKNYSK